MCGGKDRFRFDDKDGSGSFICNQCGAGYGIDLAQRVTKGNFRTVCREIDAIIGDCPPMVRDTKQDSERRKRWMLEQAIGRANDPTVVASYLAGRGLSASAHYLRGDPNCPYFDEDGREVGKFSAVIAEIMSLDGQLQSIQRVYDADVPVRKKVAPPVKTIAGAAVWLQPAAEEMGICEGWETGLACHQLFHLPIWAALSENGLQAIELPLLVRKIHIFGDNDLNFVGQAAAFIRAKRAVKDNLAVEVHIPTKPGFDWLDVLNEGGE